MFIFSFGSQKGSIAYQHVMRGGGSVLMGVGPSLSRSLIRKIAAQALSFVQLLPHDKDQISVWLPKIRCVHSCIGRSFCGSCGVRFSCKRCKIAIFDCFQLGSMGIWGISVWINVFLYLPDNPAHLNKKQNNNPSFFSTSPVASFHYFV